MERLKKYLKNMVLRTNKINFTKNIKYKRDSFKLSLLYLIIISEIIKHLYGINNEHFLFNILK